MRKRSQQSEDNQNTPNKSKGILTNDHEQNLRYGLIQVKNVDDIHFDTKIQSNLKPDHGILVHDVEEIQEFDPNEVKSIEGKFVKHSDKEKEEVSTRPSQIKFNEN